jgi:aspartate aminotransferase
MIELREAISQRFKTDYDLDYSVDEIVVSTGAKQCVFNAVQILINSGDEVIIPAPYWSSYPEMVKMAEGIPVIVPAVEENDFKLSAQQLRASITDKTRALILCSPCNPTGTVYSLPELRELAGVLSGRNIYVISDEVYAKLVYDNIDFASMAMVNNEMKNMTVLVSGVSKSYAMTGWRIGFAAGDASLMKAADKIQSHSTSNACTISQHASLAALTGPQDEIGQMRDVFEKRRDLVLAKLSGIPDVTCRKPGGALYTFPNISLYLGKSPLPENTLDLARYLLHEGRVAVIPGSAFGSEAHIRISLTCSEDKLMAGMDRLASALQKLH